MPTQYATNTIEKICRTAPVIVTPDVTDPALAAPLAQALINGRLPVIEVSIRHRNAPAVIREIARTPAAIVGAGMVLSPDDVQIARDAGAQFCTTPGTTEALLRYFDGLDLPLLPGVTTVSEAMALLDRGYVVQTFYPAGSAGGATTLAAMIRPLPQLKFCASGGINEKNMLQYKGLSNVLNVASSWVAPASLIRDQQWDAITTLAKRAARMKA